MFKGFWSIVLQLNFVISWFFLSHIWWKSNFIYERWDTNRAVQEVTKCKKKKKKYKGCCWTCFLNLLQFFFSYTILYYTLVWIAYLVFYIIMFFNNFFWFVSCLIFAIFWAVFFGGRFDIFYYFFGWFCLHFFVLIFCVCLNHVCFLMIFFLFWRFFITLFLFLARILFEVK